MRNHLIRTVLSYAGIGLGGYAIGAMFGWIITSCALGAFMSFIMMLLACLCGAIFGLFAFAPIVSTVNTVFSNKRLDSFFGLGSKAKAAVTSRFASDAKVAV